MAQVLKCDITGEADVPMLRVGAIDSAMLIRGERLDYNITIGNNTDNTATDVSEKYVLDEMIKLLNQRRNELNKIDTPEFSQSDGITKL